MSSLKDVRDVLSKSANHSTVIVCIGNTLKGDDGAGIVLYQKLAGIVSAELIDAGTVPENYIQRIIKKGPENVVMVDAVGFGGSAGEIKVFTVEQIPEVASSTHVMSLRFFADIVKRESHANICLLGIQPEQLSLGSGLSSSVEKSVAELAEVFIEHFGVDKPPTE